MAPVVMACRIQLQGAGLPPYWRPVPFLWGVKFPAVLARQATAWHGRPHRGTTWHGRAGGRGAQTGGLQAYEYAPRNCGPGRYTKRRESGPADRGMGNLARWPGFRPQHHPRRGVLWAVAGGYLTARYRELLHCPCPCLGGFHNASIFPEYRMAGKGPRHPGKDP